MNPLQMKALMASAAVTMALHPTHFQPHQPVSTPSKPQPTTDREVFKDLHVQELKTALDSITHQMASVRAKKHWQREELEVLKLHRRLLSGCLSVLENATEVTMEQLLQADELLDAYKHATS